MAKKIINIGTGELKGDGESIRSAFDKANQNFTELYNDDAADFNGAFDSLTGKPTTIAGYGITDALVLGTTNTTALAGDTALLQLGTTDTTALAGDTTFSFADITNKPTTVAGFGITDSYTDADTQTKLGNVSGNIIPDTDVTYDIGSASARFRDLYLSGSTIDLGGAAISSDGSKVALPTGSTIGGSETPEVDLNIAPETLEIQVDSPGAGQDTNWLWTWEQSTLPYARRTITNSNEINVPLYLQGTYTLNNFGKHIHGNMTQTHSIFLKWIEGAGTENLVSWATDQGIVQDSHPDINGGAAGDVQRLSIAIPSSITLPALVAPTTVVYDITFGGAGKYAFAGAAAGDNVNIGPIYRGGTYTFNVNAAGHPFYLTTDNGSNFASGTYFGEYTNGVTGSRTDSGTVTFTVPADAPDTLYYQCGNHSPMRGQITVKDLAVETNINGNFVVYFQHGQEGHKTPVEIRPIPTLVNQMCLVYDASVNKFVPQDLATYVENTPSFENKIREVAGTAELVVEDGSAVVAKVNVYNDSTYLPLAGNNIGDQAFATDNNTLYVWSGTSWTSTKRQLIAGTNITLTTASNGDITVTGQPGYTDADVGNYLSANDYDTATNIVASITDSAPATLDTLNELAAALGDDPDFATTTANNIATKMPIAGGTFTGDVNFGDGDKAIFGAGSDIQIYHDATGSGTSYIDGGGSGNLLIIADDLYINGSNSENMIKAVEDGAVTLYFNGASKVSTTASGADVTGNITVSGTVDGVDIATRDAVLTSTTTTSNAAMPKSGGTFTGDIGINGSSNLIFEGATNDDFETTIGVDDPTADRNITFPDDDGKVLVYNPTTQSLLAKDTDAVAYIGKAAIGYNGYAGIAAFGHIDGHNVDQNIGLTVGSPGHTVLTGYDKVMFKTNSQAGFSGTLVAVVDEECGIEITNAYSNDNGIRFDGGFVSGLNFVHTDLRIDGVQTGNRTIILPDKSGTVALTDEVASTGKAIAMAMIFGG